MALNDEFERFGGFCVDCPVVHKQTHCLCGFPVHIMSQDLHHAGENSYYSNIISMSGYYDFPCFDITYVLTNAKIKHYVRLM